MPIRTNRGRAAVYRRLWSWPMRSPKHLVAAAAVFAIVVITIGLLVPRLVGRDDSAGSAGATTLGETTTTGAAQPGGAGAPGAGQTTTPPPTSALPTRLSGPTQTPTSAPPAPQALEVATHWAEAWVKHPQGVTAEQWLNGLRPYSEEELMTVMASVDPANVPATAVTGPAVAKTSYTSSVEVTVPTDGGTLVITVIQTAQGWRVAHYQQAA